jgi:PPOX class probable F420-dependent enzyme
VDSVGRVTEHPAAQSRYIRFTNFRRSGEPVSTPVWIAPFGDDLVFSSSPNAGKVKRLRNDPRIEVASSDVRGRVRSGTPVYAGTARLVAPDEMRAAERALRSKYGWQWVFIGISELYRRLRRRPHEETYLVLTLGEVVRHE